MPTPLLINARSLTKSYSNTRLFTDLSLSIHQGDRIGLIGPNGSGKSTFLKILNGTETPDNGDLSTASQVSTTYLPQIDNFPADSSIGEIILEHLPDHLADWETQKRLEHLRSDMQFQDLDAPFGQLSGGWKKRVALAAALAQDSDLLFLDEPTNHLDLSGILWLENFLKNASFSYVVISHDRFFLENTCTSIMDLDSRYKQGYLKTDGNYSRFLEARETYLHHQTQEEITLSNKVRREIDWLQRGPKARTTKAQYRIDKAHSMISELGDVQQRNRIRSDSDIQFQDSNRRSKQLLVGKGLALDRGGKLLFQDLEISLSPGLSLGVMGTNGSGKSSLVKVLTGQLAPSAGSMKLAEHLQIVTLDQTRELPDESVSLRRALAPDGDTLLYQGQAVHVSSWAKRFLFSKDQLDLPVSQLSGGERARVLLADMMRKPADILIMDEPTNDLDIPTLEVLEESLKDYTGALMLITHDRYLMDRLCQQILYLDGKGEVREFADSFQVAAYQSQSHSVVEVPDPPPKPKAGGKRSHQRLRELRKELTKLERKVEKLEAQRAELEEALHDPSHGTDPVKLAALTEEMGALDDALMESLENWESLETELSELESS